MILGYEKYFIIKNDSFICNVKKLKKICFI